MKRFSVIRFEELLSSVVLTYFQTFVLIKIKQPNEKFLSPSINYQRSSISIHLLLPKSTCFYEIECSVSLAFQTCSYNPLPQGDLFSLKRSFDLPLA